MKTSIAARLAALALAWTIATHAATVYIPQSAAYRLCTWKYSTGPAEPAARWRERDFNDAAWSGGFAPFGQGVAGSVRYGTPLEGMHRDCTSVFLRKRFFVDDLAQTRALKLSVNCSGGFVAWLNGAKVAERHAPARLASDARATAAHAPSDAHRYEVFPVGNANLRRGVNVLAIQWLGAERDGAAALFDASLVDTRNLAFNRHASASSTYRGARNLRPYAAVDGTRLTFWKTVDAPTGPEWCAVDLGETRPIDKVRLAWWGGERPASSGPKEFQVQVSLDGSEWQTTAAATDRKAGEDVIEFAAVPARHVRVFMTAGRGNAYTLADFEVYEQGTPFDPRELESLASGKLAKASSQGAPITWPAAKVLDANPLAWWVSKKGAPEPHWLEIDLGAPRRIAGAKLLFGENHARHFTVRVAREPDQWRDISYATDTEEIPAGDVHRVHRLIFQAVEEARYVRLDLSDAAPHPDHVVVNEFMVIGEPPTAGSP